MGKDKSMEVPIHCALCSNRDSSVFQQLGGEDLDRISELKTCVSFKKGQVIMHEGARPQGVYCIHHGKAKMYKLGAEGKEQIIRFMAKGDLIGYRSILSDETISSSIAAMDDTFACYIPKSSFFEVIEQNPKFSLNILSKACHELGEAGKIITSLAQKTVRERLAEVLLILRATFGETEEGHLDISLTREEIANMVGTATESAIRLLSEFKEEGLIQTSGRKITVLEAVKLRQIAAIYD
jgi:CRP/FNR family transcriptional regulator